MSITIHLDDGAAYRAATGKGWMQFRGWLETLDADTFPELDHLIQFGWNQPLAAVAGELKTAAASSPPPPDVKSVVDGLLKFLGRHPEADMVIVGTD